MTFAEKAVVDHRVAGSRSRGFTLLELMFTLTVGGILLGIAVPSFIDTVRNNRVATNVNELSTAFAIARSEAVRRGANVSVCRSADGETCSGTWAQGWIVVRDSAATDTAAPVIAVVNDVLQVWPAMPGNATVATFANGAATDLGWVRFGPRGSARTSAAMPVRYDIALEGCSGQQKRTLEINTVGRATLASVAC